MGQAKQFLLEVRDQLKQINWPQRDDIIRLTIVVLFATIVTSIIFSGSDLTFTKLMAILALWH